MKKAIAITLAAIMAVTPVHVYAEGETTSEPSFLDKLVIAIEETGDKVGYTIKSAQTAAEQAAETAGSFLNEASGGASDIAAAAGEWVNKATENAAGAVEQAGEMLNNVKAGAQNLVNTAGEMLNTAVKEARDTADAAGHAVGDAANNVSTMTKETGRKISKAAQDAIDNLTGAAYYVMDSAGNIVNMVSEKGSKASETAKNVVEIISRFGPAIMEATKDSLAKIDLSDDRSEEILLRSITIALAGANRTGLLGKKMDDETIRTVSYVMNTTIVYGWRYSQGMISLHDYISVMSELIIKNGLPAGVGMLASLLPVNGASELAYNATEYLVKKVYTEDQTAAALTATPEITPAAAQ